MAFLSNLGYKSTTLPGESFNTYDSESIDSYGPSEQPATSPDFYGTNFGLSRFDLNVV